MFFFISRYIFIVHWPLATRRKMSFDLLCNADCLLCFPYLLFHAFTTRYRSAHSLFYFGLNFNSSLALCLCVYINYTCNVRVFYQRIYANTSILLLYFFIQMLALHSFKSIQISKHWLRRLFLCCSILYCATVIIYGSLWWFRILCMLHLSNVLVHSHLHFCIYNRNLINHTIPSIFNAISILHSIVVFFHVVTINHDIWPFCLATVLTCIRFKMIYNEH